MATLSDRGIPLSSVSPRYLHTNSTSHTWPFSAVAELIDNAYDPDVSAKKLWIDKTMIKDQDCLIFTDNGNGMDYEKMHKMLSFGFNEKQPVGSHVPVGFYGNGFKSGSMRLGKDAIVFSKKAGSMCVGLLSQTYLEEIKAKTVIVPIIMFTNTGQTVNAETSQTECLNDILKHSLFNTKEELLSEFSAIDGLCTSSCGTRIIIWNLRRTGTGELEFDFLKNSSDILIRVDMYNPRDTRKREAAGGESVPESEYSLRAYCSILYMKPRMKIILRGKKVETRGVIEMLVKISKNSYKPACLPSHEKGITITFGYEAKSEGHYGLMMYHKNRLIKAYERVPCQSKANNRGEGVIGVIECNYLTPTHNKQDFIKDDDYRKTITNVGLKLEKYWMEHSNSVKAIFSSAYERTLKQTKNLQQQNRQQIPCSPSSSIQIIPKPSDDASNHNSLLTTPRKTKALDLQESPEKKKAKRKCFDRDMQDLSTCQLAVFSPVSDANKVECIDSKTALMKDDFLIDLGTAMKEHCNQITQKNSEDQQNYKVLYLQAMEEIKQLTEKVKELKEDMDTLEDKCESMKKDSEEVKKKNEKVESIEDPGSRTEKENDLQQWYLCSHSGKFHCKSTNLVFDMKEYGEVAYTVVSWDESPLQGLDQFLPAGPLYSIDYSESSIHYLHLPHCEIQTGNNQIELAVAHFSDDDNTEILQPLKKIDTHVIIKAQHMSFYGLLKKSIFRQSPINVQVILFYQNIDIRRKLQIHLLPGNVPVEEVQKQHEGSTYIKCTSLCQLIPGKKYSPLCEPYVSQPKVEIFGCDYGPNYHPTFEVILNTEVEDLTLSLLDELGQEVWSPHQVTFTGNNIGAVPVEMDEMLIL